MANRIRTGDSLGFNKGHSSKFRISSQVRQTPEEGRRTYQLKYCGNNNEDEDNSLKTLNDKNHQASSQKFRQLTVWKKFHFIILERSDFHMISNLTLVVNICVWSMLTSLSVDKILLPRYMNWSANLKWRWLLV